MGEMGHPWVFLYFVSSFEAPHAARPLPLMHRACSLTFFPLRPLVFTAFNSFRCDSESPIPAHALGPVSFPATVWF